MVEGTASVTQAAAGCASFVAEELGALQEKAAAFIQGLPDTVASIRRSENVVFRYATADAAEESFRSGVASTAGDAVNSDVKAALRLVHAKASENAVDFDTLYSWVNLSVPRCETGNNFGVEVQELVLKALKAAKDETMANLAKLPEYHKARAEVIARFGMEVTSEKEVLEIGTKTDTKTSGQNDKSEDVSSSKTSTKTLSKKLRAVEDFSAYVIELDLEWYFKLRMMLRTVVASRIALCDLLVKNMSKLLDPRNNSSEEDRRGGRMMMY